MGLYDSVADLPVTVESYSLARHEQSTSSGFERVTTTVALHGPEHTGYGEDVTYDTDDHDVFQDRHELDLAGSFTVDEFSAHLDGVDAFPEPPERAVSRQYRRWALESAALDLALKRAGRSFHEAVGRDVDALRFVASTRLGDPPSVDRLRALRERVPGVEFKLDPTSDWTPAFAREVSDVAPVRILDLKGHYEGTDVDASPDPELYALVLETFPEAIVEDPALTPETEPVLDGHMDRVSWDAPIHGLDDVHALAHDPEYLNVKPSRFGRVESLLDTVEWALANDVTCYGGGQFELDVGRGHLHELAATFHPDAPNDVAPASYNDVELADSLPASPLDPPGDATGLGWS